jgi:hypothetical protein
VQAIRSSVVLVAVTLVHVCAIYLLAMGVRSSRVISSSAQPRSMLFFVAPKTPGRSRPMRGVIEQATALHRSAIESQPPALRDSAIIEPSGAINWTEGAAGAVSGLLARQRAAEEARSLDSKAKLIELPKGGLPHQIGDSQRFADGELITWINDQCYVSNRPLAGPQLDPGRPNVVCKDRSALHDDLFDYLKPSYLRALDPAAEGLDTSVREHPPAPSCSYSTFKCK